MTDDKDQEIADLKARLAALEQKGAPPRNPFAHMPSYHDPVAPKRKGLPAWVWIVGGLVLLLVIASIASKSGGSQGATNAVAVGAPTNAAPAVASAEPANAALPAASTGNVLNDALLRKPSAEQARILARAVGGHCHGVRAFYDGIGRQGMFAGTAYWSVACRDGQSYMVTMSPDDTNNKAIECSVIRAVAGVDCFTSF